MLPRCLFFDQTRQNYYDRRPIAWHRPPSATTDSLQSVYSINIYLFDCLFLASLLFIFTPQHARCFALYFVVALSASTGK